MRTMKKVFVLFLAVVLMLSLSVTAFAGNNGKITLTNATPEKIYNAYKIFDATVGENGNIAYTYEGTLPENDYFVADEGGNISATEAAKDDNGYLTAGAIEFLATLKGEEPTASETAENATVVFTGLAYGYYYIETDNGAAVTVDSTNPEATVIDKNQDIQLTKTIVEGDHESTTNSVNVGEKVNYKIEIQAPNYKGLEYITNYFVYDTMDEALTYNNDLTITVNNKTIKETDDYVLLTGKDADPCNFQINIPWVSVTEATEGTPASYSFKYNDENDAISTIVVEYSATVNEKVEIGTPMENNATYNYKSTPTPPVTPPGKEIIEPDEDIPVSTTQSYATILALHKIDENEKTLTGAKFKIAGDSYIVSLITEEIFAEVGTETGTHYMLKNGTFTTEAPILADYESEEEGKTIKANVDLYDNTDKKYAKVTNIDKDTNLSKIISEGWVNEEGYINFKGLGEGEYTITELVSPSGFNLLTAPIEVKIIFDEETKSYSAKVGSEEDSIDADEDGVISINVVNGSGTELPSTGGIGTTIFYTLGGLLIVVAGVLLITKKRMSAKN